MTATNTSVFAFGAFRLNPAQRSLSRNGQAIVLTPKEFDTLLVLVEACGRVVDKEELLARVWPDSFVGDGSLARNISVLRKALGEELIETHRGRGYRVSVPIQLAAEPISISAPALPEAEPIGVDAAQAAKISFRQRLPIAAFAVAAIVAVTIFTFRSFSARGVQARASTSAPMIRSILIQKEGALDPLDEGFKLARPDTGQYPQAVHNRETNGWDRWRIRTNDQNYYFRPLTTAEKEFALQRDWKLTCVCAVESSGAFTDVDFGGKGPRFDIELLQEGDRYFVALTRQISPVIELDEKIEFPGVADVAHPHTYQLRYDHVSKTASLWIDGKLMASGYQGHHQFQEDKGILFGVAIYGNVDQSSAVFREVRFEAH